MNTRTIIFITLLCFAVNACNKEAAEPDDQNPSNPALPFEKSKRGLLCHEWTLKETFIDDVQKSSNGTDRYKFETDGGFYFYESGDWKQLATYNFTTRDSNSLAMKFEYGGSSFTYFWEIKKLDQKNYNVEFMANDKKLNYNYVR